MRGSRWAILAIIPIALLLVAAGALYIVSPPKALDVLNDFWPGDSGTARIATAIPFSSGEDRKLDIWARPDTFTTRKPVLIFFYGGAWVKGRRQDYGFVGKAYAARGFVVVLADYRKVPGVRFPAFVSDGAAAVRWVHDNIARYGGDPDRIVLGGHSAGAYIAIMLALDRSSFARKEAPPLWLGTGSSDTEVRPRNSVSLAQREHGLGNTTTVLRIYPGFSHNDLIMAISKPFRKKGPVLDETVSFYLRNTTPAASPPVPR